MNWRRWIKHESTGKGALAKVLSSKALEGLTQEIAQCEKRHSGEIRLVIETSLDFNFHWQGVTARERALQVFSHTRVWDTEANNGVLIYLLLADRDIEIVADRGFNKKVSAPVWEKIAVGMEQSFRQNRFEEGLRQGIKEISQLIEEHFQPRADDKNELPNAPLILG